MRRVVLLFNPNSGRNPQSRSRIVEKIAETLRSYNLHVSILATEGPNTAGRQAAQVQADIVFACGGDGTIHEVLQGLAFRANITLGIIPLGSANAFARHLGLSLDPIRAALQQLAYEQQTIPAGRVTYTTPEGLSSRYFLVMAGAGPNGELVYKMLAGSKHRLGRLMYYFRAARLFAGKRFSAFPVTTGSVTRLAVSAMAVRVASLGGLFGPLVRGASIEDAHLTVSIARTPASLSLPAWFALSWSRLDRLNPYVECISSSRFDCGSGLTAPVQVQADGEHLGTTPMTVDVVPDAVRLLLPPQG